MYEELFHYKFNVLEEVPPAASIDQTLTCLSWFQWSWGQRTLVKQ